MTFYRYDFHDVGISIPEIRIYIIEFFLVKETPKGYWIQKKSPFMTKKRWIPKESRVRYAYPTKAEALEYFIKRKERYLSILESKVSSTKAAIQAAKMITL